MKREDYFQKDFYCAKCGSKTAIIVDNLGVVRCMGCLGLYKLKEGWEKADKSYGYGMPPPGRNEVIVKGF